MSKRFENKTALVTGASRGIGAAVAKALAAEGAHVILIARSVGGLEEVDDAIQSAGGSATLVPLDLLETDAIDGLAAPLLERFKKLDMLVAAAGTLGKLTPAPQYSPKLWEDVFKLNVHANWRLLRALDPLLRASDAGRAVFVTASAAREHKLYWSGYAASKAALESLVLTYAGEVAKTNLKVNLIDPGPTATKLRLSAFPGEDQSTLPTPEQKTDLFLDALSSEFNQNGTLIT
ncbi:SDR family NAD(P)-dependent oxidoreductase [Sneathiella aquimaris]|uniref:SDR family NAD(P)-dependent oxidoreductase n=1 Tax=Sneathiella aquimaris TaxID=2599305 RepID=UPI00146D1263|nr:SDR family NAD(P)-dependent oxidoreductase [Sneathiella aquimaris]